MRQNPPKPARTQLEDLVQKNVEAITRIEEASRASRTRSDVVADMIAGFCGSPAFVYVHIALFGGWLIWNSTGLVSKSLHFDPVPFNILTLVVSLEAIFLSTFILISQNRQQRMADQRNHLDLQINLLAEQESSHMLAMMKKVMDHLGIEIDSPEQETLQEDTDPERLAEQIQRNLDSTGGGA